MFRAAFETAISDDIAIIKVHFYRMMFPFVIVSLTILISMASFYMYKAHSTRIWKSFKLMTHDRVQDKL